MSFLSRWFKRKADDTAKTGKHAEENQDKQELPKRRNKNAMRDIINESVTASALEQMANNEDFVIKKSDGTKNYVGMMLHMASIGGINKKSRKDEDKGEIIELINSGAIKTYMPDELYDDESIIIIPDEETLGNMEEFALLTEAPYYVTFVSTEGDIEERDAEIDFVKWSSVVEGNQDIYDLLTENGFSCDKDGNIQIKSENAESENADENTSNEDNSENAENQKAANDFEDELSDDDAPADATNVMDKQAIAAATESNTPKGAHAKPKSVETVDKSVDTQKVSEVETDPEDAASDDELNEEVPQAQAQQPVQQPAQQPVTNTIISDDSLDQAIKRRFYSDDLNLEVTTEPFDAQFLHTNNYVPFDENRGDGWLNGYINELSRTANIAMRKVHHDNLFRMREEYFKLISQHVEQIQKELSFEDKTTEYGKRYIHLLEDYNNNKKKSEATVAKEVEKLKKSWDENLKRIGEQAANNAKDNYINRYGKQHEDELNHVENKIEVKCRNDYDDSVRDLEDQRRYEAARRLDAGVYEVLRAVSDDYMKCLDEEKKMYERWQRRIDNEINKHRADDLAHDKLLAEEQSRRNQVIEVRAEYNEKLKTQAADFDARTAELRNDMARDRINNEKHIAQIQAEHKKHMAKMSADNDVLQARIDKLLKDYAELDSKKENEYKARIRVLKDQREAEHMRYDDVVRMNRRGSAVSITLGVVGAIAAAAIGVIVGMNMSGMLGTNRTDPQTDMIHELSRRLDDYQSRERQRDMPTVSKDRSKDEKPVVNDTKADKSDDKTDSKSDKKKDDTKTANDGKDGKSKDKQSDKKSNDKASDKSDNKTN